MKTTRLFYTPTNALRLYSDFICPSGVSIPLITKTFYSNSPASVAFAEFVQETGLHFC